MAAEITSHLTALSVLAVDDEKDILDTIEDVLDEAKVDRATDYDSASQKLKDRKYDLAILDIMGVNGLDLLVEAVNKGIPTVMLTAHAMKPENDIRTRHQREPLPPSQPKIGPARRWRMVRLECIQFPRNVHWSSDHPNRPGLD